MGCVFSRELNLEANKLAMSLSPLTLSTIGTRLFLLLDLLREWTTDQLLLEKVYTSKLRPDKMTMSALTTAHLILEATFSVFFDLEKDTRCRITCFLPNLVATRSWQPVLMIEHHLSNQPIYEFLR